VSPRRPSPLVAALALAAAACAGERPSRATAPPPERAAPALERAPSVPRGRYGPEPEADPSPLERGAMAAVAERAARGRRPLTSDALVLAARALAREAADGAGSPLAPGRVRAALAGALAYDYAPAAHLVSAPADRAAEVLASRVAPGEWTHLGAGALVRGRQAWIVLLLSRRPASLQPFPRDVAVGARATLAGSLAGLDAPRVYVAGPAGASREVPAADRGRAFSADLRFDERGRYTVEVVGRGPNGPQVAALLVVSAGGAPLAAAEAAAAPEPSDARGAEAGVVAAVNAARRARGLAVLEPSSALSDVARAHAEDMLSRGLLAHVLPGSGDPGERLRRARIPYRVVLENLGKGATALDAHHAIEDSPAHLAAILSRDVERVGCGIARGRLLTGEPVVYLTELFLAPVADGSADRMTPEARVREALWRERERAGGPPLASDPALDALARTAAREMLRSGEPGAGHLGDEALGLGRKMSAVDAFVASSPADAVRSRNLPDRRLRRVGVGVTVGDSARYGAGLLWIAVVYTD
jgi:uncharacterized protein YkwD